MTDDPAARSLTMIRVCDVPARHLFDSFRTAGHLMAWFGPADYPVTECQSDFQVGGSWRMRMTGPDGAKGPPFGGIWREILPHERLVFDNGFEGAPQKMLMTFTFTEIAGRTTLQMVTLFESPAMKDEFCAMGFEQGTGITLDQLTALAASLAA